jgi:putative salt-induced outer membrane protein YdiY
MLTALLITISIQAQICPPPSTQTSDACAATGLIAQSHVRISPADYQSDSQADALSVTRAVQAEDILEAEPKPAGQESPWRGSVGLGLIALSGNASTLSFHTLGLVEHKTERWIFSARGQAVYGYSRPPAKQTKDARTQVVALGAGVHLREDYRFTRVVNGFLLVGAETDHVQSVEFRGTGVAGTSILWWDEHHRDGRVSSLRSDLGFRFLRETRFHYYPEREDLPDVVLGGPHVGLSLRYSLSQSITFSAEVDAAPNLLGESRLLVNSHSRLSVKLTETLSFGTNLVVRYDSAPPEGKVSTDTALSASIEVAF